MKEIQLRRDVHHLAWGLIAPAGARGLVVSENRGKLGVEFYPDQGVREGYNGRLVWDVDTLAVVGDW